MPTWEADGTPLGTRSGPHKHACKRARAERLVMTLGFGWIQSQPKINMRIPELQE